MQKAHLLQKLTGCEILVVVASDTGHVYSYATQKLDPLINSDTGKELIQKYLNEPRDRSTAVIHGEASTRPEQHRLGGPTKSEAKAQDSLVPAESTLRDALNGDVNEAADEKTSIHGTSEFSPQTQSLDEEAKGPFGRTYKKRRTESACKWKGFNALRNTTPLLTSRARMDYYASPFQPMNIGHTPLSSHMAMPAHQAKYFYPIADMLKAGNNVNEFNAGAPRPQAFHHVDGGGLGNFHQNAAAQFHLLPSGYPHLLQAEMNFSEASTKENLAASSLGQNQISTEAAAVANSMGHIVRTSRTPLAKL